MFLEIKMYLKKLKLRLKKTIDKTLIYASETWIPTRDRKQINIFERKVYRRILGPVYDDEEVHQLFIDFKKAYDSVRREVIYKILIECGIPRKLVGLIKMSLTETYSRIQVGNNVSDRFPVRNGLKQGNALSPLLFNFALE